MADKVVLTNHEVDGLAREVAIYIQDRMGAGSLIKLYGVPRGGVSAAYMVSRHLHHSVIVDLPSTADFIIDDLIDSGKTLLRFTDICLENKSSFLALVDKRISERYHGKWIVFPWERSIDEEDQSADDIVTRLIEYIGENPAREGLIETPKRVLKAWKHWTSGYNKEPKDVLKVFTDGAERYDEMIVENDLPFYSHCEHHLAPFFGTATIAYIPDGKVCGLSKMHRVLDIFARRLQMQERLTVQTADALMSLLQPKGVGVIIKARHFCKESRGIGIQGSFTTTSALRGKFLTEPSVRAEFLNFAK